MSDGDKTYGEGIGERLRRDLAVLNQSRDFLFGSIERVASATGSDDLPINDNDQTDGTMHGTLRCLSCGHEDEDTVMPVGEVWGACPACGSGKAIMKHPGAAEEGDQVWTCSCGCDVFFITPKAVRCCNCGQSHRPFD